MGQKELKMKITAYHYTDNKFDSFDEKKSDGFWFTTLSPNATETDESGSSGAKFCAVCEITFNEDTAIENGKNHDVFESIDSVEGCDAIVNKYDGFTDYALRRNNQIKIIKWIDN